MNLQYALGRGAQMVDFLFKRPRFHVKIMENSRNLELLDQKRISVPRETQKAGHKNEFY